jgi:anion-transporting  ArsA/GET3 family ATPase
VDPAQFLTASRVVIVAGKGGVGKTLVAATLARAAARCGLTTLVVEVEGKSGLPAFFGRSTLGYDEVVLSAGGGPDGAADVRARTLTPDDALLDYLADHGMHRISRRLVNSGAIDMVATAAPGIRDILVLGKIKQIETSGAFDLVIVDAPAAGHAITFLRSASGLLDAVSVGPIHTQAADVVAMLADPRRCQVMLVTLPEETPVNELVQTAYALEEEVGVHLAPVVVNGLYPALDGLDVDPTAAADAAGIGLDDGLATALRDAAAFRVHRRRLQDLQVDRLSAQLPLPRLELPYLFTSSLGPEHLDVLSDALLEQIPALPDLGALGGPST